MYPTYVLLDKVESSACRSTMPVSKIWSALRRTAVAHIGGPSDKCPVVRRRTANGRDADWLKTFNHHAILCAAIRPQMHGPPGGPLDTGCLFMSNHEPSLASAVDSRILLTDIFSCVET